MRSGSRTTYPEIVKVLVRADGIDVNADDLLLLAVRKGDEDMPPRGWIAGTAVRDDIDRSCQQIGPSQSCTRNPHPPPRTH